MAIEATDNFFDKLRTDLGNKQFNILFSINPSSEQLDTAAYAIEHRERFRFFMRDISIGLSNNSVDFDKIIKERNKIITEVAYHNNDPDLPTLDVSDIIDETEDIGIHSGILLINDEEKSHKRRINYRRR